MNPFFPTCSFSSWLTGGWSLWTRKRRRHSPDRGPGAGRPALARPAIEALEDRWLLAAGALDLTFGTGGRTTVHFGGTSYDTAQAMAVQADGKIILAGNTTAYGNEDFAVARLLPDGTPDPGFGTGGQVLIPFDLVSGGLDRAYAVALGPDHKIVVAGIAQYAGTDYDFAVARLHPDGTLDTSFDGDGKRTVAVDLGPPGFRYDEARGVAVQPDGKILLAGSALRSPLAGYDFAAARLLANGDLDTAGFGTGGKTTVAFDLGGGLRNDRANAVALQPDGKIVLAGSADGAIPVSRFAVARLLPNGTLDATGFGAGGKTTVAFAPPGRDIAYAVALQLDGKIVLAGSTTPADIVNWDFAVARLTAGGQPDPGFGGYDTSGRATVRFDRGGDYTDVATGVAVQSDGKIVLGGSSRLGAGDNYDFAAARLHLNGTLDPAFGSHGKAVVSFDRTGRVFSVAAGMALQPDGRIVLAGAAIEGTSTDLAVARLHGDPAAAIVTDFGALGLWRWTEAGSWQLLTAGDPAEIDQADNGDVFATLADGLWRWTEEADGLQLSAVAPRRTELTAGGDAHCDFGVDGLWRWRYGVGWQPWSSSDAEDFDVTVDGIVYADFGSLGLWRRAEGGDWQRVTDLNPRQLVVAAVSGEVVADLGPIGQWRWSVALGWRFLTSADTEALSVSDYGVLYADLGGSGLWHWTEASGWQLLSPDDPAEIDAAPTGALVVSFGAFAGLWGWEPATGSWGAVSPFSPSQIVVAADGTLFGDFGDLGLWRQSGDWLQLSELAPEDLSVRG